jgi:uncharacterized protein YdeI (BOF family)
MDTNVFNQSIATAAVAAGLAASVGSAQADDTTNPYLQPDDSWISISGTVVEPRAEHFMLDYGSGMITVEMDDWDSYGEAHSLMDGDKVRVFGRVDDDLFEVSSIEAGSVYVENLNTFFHASAADEELSEMPVTYWTVSVPVTTNDTTLTGTVKTVDRDEGEFVIDMAGMDITVETDNLGYNPLDDKGYQQIAKGDRVSVTGKLDYEFIDGQVFYADYVTTVRDRDLPS